MKLIIILSTLFAFTSSSVEIDYSNLKEKSVAVQLNNSETLTNIVAEKCSFMAGESFPGYNSKLSVKGIETALKVKKGTSMVFYVRGSATSSSFPLSCVQMDLTKNKRIASSKEGMTADKDKVITSIPVKSVQLDKVKKIYKVTLNEEPGVGVWCINFRRVYKGQFVLGSGYGKEVFCFEIIE